MFSSTHFGQLLGNKGLLGMITILSAIISLPLAAQTECNAAEVGYVASFDVKPGSEATFEKAILKLAETVRRVESGVVFYAPFKGVDGKYYMMERYQDASARKNHATSEEVKALFPDLLSNLNTALDVQAVSAVCP